MGPVWGIIQSMPVVVPAPGAAPAPFAVDLNFQYVNILAAFATECVNISTSTFAVNPFNTYREPWRVSVDHC